MAAGCASYDDQLLSGTFLAGATVATCGDAELGPLELCDIGIPPGARGACPSTCAPGANPCAPRLRVGEGCQVQCAAVPVTAALDGDGCCLRDKDGRTDSDCPCGGDDGDAGAVCAPDAEPDAEPDDEPPQVCPSSCDDRDSCTIDTIAERSGDCASCLHTRIWQTRTGDDCCPRGATNATDRDCNVCGDGRAEPPEACDGEDGCTSDCRWGGNPDPDSDLVHRYSFDESGEEVRDSIGGADGMLINCEVDGDGDAQLPRTRLGYVELPGGLVSAYESATLEFWMVWGGDLTRRYERIFDFGSRTGPDDDPEVESTLFLSPNYDPVRTMRLFFRSVDGQEARLVPATRFPSGDPVHVAVVLDGGEQMLSLYLNGVRAGAARWSQRLADLRDTNTWLGRSQYPDDPGLYGSFDEFRIYRTALSAAAIERSYALGPAQLP